MSDVGIALILLIAFSFVISGHSVYVVAEKSNREKRLQLIYGIPLWLYWFVTFVWHLV